MVSLLKLLVFVSLVEFYKVNYVEF